MCEAVQSEKRGRQEEKSLIFQSHVVLFIGQPISKGFERSNSAGQRLQGAKVN